MSTVNETMNGKRMSETMQACMYMYLIEVSPKFYQSLNHQQLHVMSGSPEHECKHSSAYLSTLFLLLHANKVHQLASEIFLLQSSSPHCTSEVQLK